MPTIKKQYNPFRKWFYPCPIEGLEKELKKQSAFQCIKKLQKYIRIIFFEKQTIPVHCFAHSKLIEALETLAQDTPFNKKFKFILNDKFIINIKPGEIYYTLSDPYYPRTIGFNIVYRWVDAHLNEYHSILYWSLPKNRVYDSFLRFSIDDFSSLLCEVHIDK